MVVDGEVGGGEDPQPLELAADLPAGFVGAEDRSLIQCPEESLVGGLGSVGQAIEGLREAAPADPEAEGRLEEARALPEGQPEPLVEVRGQGHGLRSQVGAGSTHGLRGLPGVPSSDRLPAGGAVAELDPETGHMGPHRREIGLVLIGRVVRFDGPATGGADLGECDLDDLVYVLGDRTAGRRALVGTRAATGLLGPA